MFARIDYDDKAKRLSTNDLQTIWKSSPSLGNIADIFTEELYQHYSPPHDFCFDIKCADPPIMVSLTCVYTLYNINSWYVLTGVVIVCV